MTSRAPAKLDDPAPIALRWPTLRQNFKLAHRLPLRGCLLPHFFAGFGFMIKRLRGGSRTAHVAQSQDVHLELPAIVGHAQPITDPDLARGFGDLSVG